MNTVFKLFFIVAFLSVFMPSTYSFGFQVTRDILRNGNMDIPIYVEAYSGNAVNILWSLELPGSNGEVTEDQRVYLYGVNTPELDTVEGQEAKDLLDVIMSGSDIVLDKSGLENNKSDETLVNGWISLDDDMYVLIQSELVYSGYAWVTAECQDTLLCEYLREEERQAKKDKRGMWK